MVILFSHTRGVRFIKLKSCNQRPSGGALRRDGGDCYTAMKGGLARYYSLCHALSLPSMIRGIHIRVVQATDITGCEREIGKLSLLSSLLPASAPGGFLIRFPLLSV